MRIESGAIDGGSGFGAVIRHDGHAVNYSQAISFARWLAEYGLIATAPVVDILSTTPFALEGGFTLTHSRGVIEVPCATCLLGAN